MRIRSGRFGVGAAVLVGAMMLTACGESEDSKEDEQVTAEEKPAGEITEPDPEEAEEEPVDSRPEIDLGREMENVHEAHSSGDSRDDVILRDLQGFNDAVDEAIVSFENDRPALRYYIAGDALHKTVLLLNGIYEGGESSGGATRYYAYEITRVDESAATFRFCRDYRGVYSVDAETRDIVGDVDPNAIPDLYFGRQELNEAGVWQTVAYDFEQASPECV